jgi:hypothetical protein
MCGYLFKSLVFNSVAAIERLDRQLTDVSFILPQTTAAQQKTKRKMKTRYMIAHKMDKNSTGKRGQKLRHMFCQFGSTATTPFEKFEKRATMRLVEAAAEATKFGTRGAAQARMNSWFIYGEPVSVVAAK